MYGFIQGESGQWGKRGAPRLIVFRASPILLSAVDSQDVPGFGLELRRRLSGLSATLDAYSITVSMQMNAFV